MTFVVDSENTTMLQILPFEQSVEVQQAVEAYQNAEYPIALTGAGISVASGIPDFRSPGGLWSIFNPEEYATLEVFLRNPDKAWQLYRELGLVLLDKEPSKAHNALVELEREGLLKAVITQNVDRLHQKAGSRQVVEIHGEHQHLQCLQCRNRMPVSKSHYQGRGSVPCPKCGFPLKPGIVLFGEDVREYDRIAAIASKADFLLVIGTSAQVYPAAEIPFLVKRNNGRVYEFNQEHVLARQLSAQSGREGDYCFKGDVEETLPWFVSLVVAA
ncbi:NAD-dependent deacetylase [Desulfogranum marinum]|uniref:SIR2 family NAD-dependent protein deacylase n=1 Tax=Desulfogranum marinum TaxID=453220 RepID=UPI0019626B82|nr:NAD-dependent deacylase [Desulfogranum marinum]MBM9513855.1 NAD-dependent deacylase [Desulfogranum marinum]